MCAFSSSLHASAFHMRQRGSSRHVCIFIKFTCVSVSHVSTGFKIQQQQQTSACISTFDVRGQRKPVTIRCWPIQQEGRRKSTRCCHQNNMVVISAEHARHQTFNISSFLHLFNSISSVLQSGFHYISLVIRPLFIYVFILLLLCVILLCNVYTMYRYVVCVSYCICMFYFIIYGVYVNVCKKFSWFVMYGTINTY